MFRKNSLVQRKLIEFNYYFDKSIIEFGKSLRIIKQPDKIVPKKKIKSI